MNIKAAAYDINDLSIKDLGHPAIQSCYNIDKGLFVSDETKVLYNTNTKDITASASAPKPAFETAGPRENLFFDPKNLTCGIVTCGGLCPA